MIVQDNKTRWNSIFSMIQRAFLLKDGLDLFIKRAQEKSTNESPLPKDDELSANDWHILARVRGILQPFYDLTLRLQSRASCATHGSIWEALPTLDFLLNELEEKSKEYGARLTEESTTLSGESAKKSTKNSRRAVQSQKPGEERDTPDITHISTSINSSWAKLRKYYQLMDQSPVYAAAVALNPEHKWDYFRTNWAEHPDWISQAEKSVEDLWLTMYKYSANSAEPDAKAKHGLLLPILQKEPSDIDQWVSRHKYRRPGTKKEQDEYIQYLQTEYFPDQELEGMQSTSQLMSVDLRALWARYEAQHPSLARMAFDILSIPAMSAECERVFSSTKLLPN